MATNGYNRSDLTTGDVLTEAKIDNIDNGVFNAYFQSEATTLLDGVTLTLTYTAGDLTEVLEKTSGAVNIRRSTLTYSAGNLSTVNVKIYETDGSTVDTEYTDTLTYTGSDLTSVSRSVS